MAPLDALLAALHYFSIIAVFATLTGELLWLRPALIAQTARALAGLDAAFGIAAGAALASGLARAVWGVKGWAFYAHNPVFHAKVGLFVVIGILSIWPTLMFLRWRRSLRRDPAYTVPPAELKRARRFVMIELHLLVLLPVFAVMMSRGLRF